MKLYLVDSYEISTYSLPDKIEDAFVIHYTHYSGKEETITFIAKEGKWVIKSSSEMNLMKNSQIIDKSFMEIGDIYDIKFGDLNDVLTMYCYDIHQEFNDYKIDDNLQEIIVGKNTDAHIIYDNPKMNLIEFKIQKQNNIWILNDNGLSQSKIYINEKRETKRKLSFGDVIFTNGLIIIWFETFIRCNNPKGKVKNQLSLNTIFSKEEENNNTYTPVNETERNIVLYNDNQVFFHTPRMKESIIKKEIEIEKPPQISSLEDLPIVLSVGTTAIMGLSSMFTGLMAISRVSSQKSTLEDVAPEIVLCITMVIGCIILPVIIEQYNKKKNRQREETRKKVYREYLESVKEEIQNEIEKEERILNNNYLNVEQLQNIVETKSNKIWNREIGDNDFLTIRLGIGIRSAAIKLNFPKIAYDIDKDVLITEAQEIANEKLILKNVPLTISLIDNIVLPLVITNDYEQKKQFLNYLMLQMISLYSGNDLKIVVFTTKHNKEQWNFLKYLPHCADKTRTIRFFAETEEESKQLSNFLEKEYQKRYNSVYHQKTEDDKEEETINVNQESEAYRFFEPYYLIITDNYVSIQNYGVIPKILNHSVNIGFSLLTIEPTMQNVPSKCKNMVVVNNNGAGIVNKSLNENTDHNTFTPDLLVNNIKHYSQIIANIPLSTEAEGNKLPKVLSFLDMYKVGKIEQLNIMNRWSKNNPTLSITAPIGVHEDGKVFEIDLHEKAHGPHGLIAGATGSGKSEFIITFILSMAINYHPYEVQFVLIDYKGGGLAGAFENQETGIRLPHLVGTITNLDESEMNRTLVSINSELKRRQRMFNEARDRLNESTVDIYKYQRFYREGKVKEPISHLFIICDEFAELKAQQPDFMDSLVSTARIGRSLGVHLILATQKPSGVVDDQIWSNARFKVCLKVSTQEDSRELLRRPEAAEIKETGRFYLQVGFDELFELGQSGWAGAKYNPTDYVIKNINDSIDIIDNIGNVIKTINNEKIENLENYGEQGTNIVKTIYNLAKREQLKMQSMWLPSIPTEIYIYDLIQKYQYTAKKYEINPLIGEYDDPEKQYQGAYTINLTENGNLLIYGLGGSGKENLVTTILYSICLFHTSEEVNIYILDFGAEVLKVLYDMPQVGDVALINDKDKIKSILVMLDRELAKRKELFSNYGGSYKEFIKNNNNKLPTIIVVLNGWDTFAETYLDYTDIVGRLSRECAKYGIILITTMVTINSMMTSIQQNYNNKIALQLSDTFDYKFLLNAKDGLIPKKAFSRGLGLINEEVYEFQGAYIYQKDQINEVIKQSAEELSKNQRKAPPIPIIPAIVTADTLAPHITNLSSVPLGIEIHTANVYKFNFIKNKITPIIGNYIITDTPFLMELLKILNTLQDTKLKIIDFMDIVSNVQDYEDYYNNQFTDAITSIITNEREETKQMIYVLIGIGRIHDKVLDEGIELLTKIFNNVEAFKKSSFILVDNYSAYRKITTEEWYKKVDPTKGIWVGADIGSQTIIKHPPITKADENEDFNGIVYAINTNEYKVLKGIGTKPEDEII